MTTSRKIFLDVSTFEEETLLMQCYHRFKLSGNRTLFERSRFMRQEAAQAELLRKNALGSLDAPVAPMGNADTVKCVKYRS